MLFGATVAGHEVGAACGAAFIVSEDIGADCSRISSRLGQAAINLKSKNGK